MRGIRGMRIGAIVGRSPSFLGGPIARVWYSRRKRLRVQRLGKRKRMERFRFRFRFHFRSPSASSPCYCTGQHVPGHVIRHGSSDAGNAAALAHGPAPSGHSEGSSAQSLLPILAHSLHPWSRASLATLAHAMSAESLTQRARVCVGQA
jgi:hypothetical protein